MADTMSPTYTTSDVQQRLDSAKQAAQANTGMTNPEAVRQALAQQTFDTDQPLQQTIAGQTGALSAMDQLRDYDRQLAGQVNQANQQQMQRDTALRAQTTQMGAFDPTNAQATIAAGPATFDTTEILRQATPTGLLSPFVASSITSGQQRANIDTFDIAALARQAREKYLGGQVSALASLYQAQLEAEALKEKEAANAKQQQFENALAIAKLTGKTSFKDPITGEVYSVKPDSNLTQTERQQAGLVNQLRSDISTRMTPKDLFAKYGGSVDFNTIMTEYNASSPWGPAKESMDELRSLYEGNGVKETKQQSLSESDKRYYRQQSQAKESVMDFVQNLEELRKLTQEIGIVGSLTPGNPRMREFSSKRDTLGRQLARLVETGVITNQDAEFYGKQLPRSAVGLQGQKDAAIDTAIDFVISAASNKYGVAPDEARRAIEIKQQLSQDIDSINSARSMLQSGESLYYDMNTGEYVAVGVDEVPQPGMIRI